MNNILVVVIIAIALSMDAFSASLGYGTLNFDKRKIFIISLTVGLFHFFMPIVGAIIGHELDEHLILNTYAITGIIFLIIGFQMLITSFKCKEISQDFNTFLFGFAVSLDSFSTGIGMGLLDINIFLIVFIFSLISFLFTLLGFYLGKNLYKIIEKKAILIGASILITIGFRYLLK